jgi:hypothetical protein
MDPVTLYDPMGGQPVTTRTPTEAVRLRSAGYSDAPQFNPAEHKVEEVREHLAANPDDAPRVVAVERQTKARKTIVGSTDGVVQTGGDSSDTSGSD